MPRVLIVAEQADNFEALARSLAEAPNAEILWAHDGETALGRVTADSPDLVVVDEFIGEASGLEWIRNLVGVNAFIQTAAVSSTPQDAFHEAAEGLGVMLQLPPRPGKFEAELLLRTLDQLSGA